MIKKVLQGGGFWVFLVSMVSCLDAAEYTWDKGAGTLDWNDPVNWSSNTKPGATDTASFTATGLTSGDVVLLGTNQTIGTFRLNGSPSITISGGGLYSLTLNNGRIQGNDSNPTVTHTLDVPIVLGTSGSFQAQGGYGGTLAVKGAISDNGNGYGIVFVPNQNHLHTLEGNNTYSGDTVYGGRNLTLLGADGAIRNSALVINMSVAQFSTVTLDNTATANNDRLGDTKPVRFENNGGKLRLVGNASTPITENVGTLRLLSGLGSLEVSRQGAAGATTELNLAAFERSPGTGLRVLCNTTSDAYNWYTQPRIVLTGVADGLLPYAAQDYYDPSHIVVESGLVKKFSAYTPLPLSGGSDTIIHNVTTNLSLTGDVDTKALMLRQTSTNSITLDLGDHDLRVASGSIGFGMKKSHTIQASGSGRLVFGSQDLSFFAAGESADVITVSAPLASSVTGPHNLIVPLIRAFNRLQLTGPDYIGAYSNLVVGGGGGALELGGPSNRVFTGSITGWGNLRKSGSGTLRLVGPDLRPDGTTTVMGGRLAVANPAALHWFTYTDGMIIVTNATLEVESGVTWDARFSLQTGSTLTGDGKINTTKTITNTVHVAPGHAVGKLTTASLTFGANSHLDWELGTNTVTAGTDYDLLRVEGALSLPTGTINVNLSDAGNGSASVRGKTFTLVEWTGADPVNTPTWTIINHAEKAFDASAASIVINTVDNKILLSGLRTAPTTIIIR